MTKPNPIYLTRWLDDDCWEAAKDCPRDFLDYGDMSSPVAYGLHSDEQVAIQFGKDGLLAELRSTFDYEDAPQEDLDALERIDAATWTEGEWTAMAYHPGCEAKTFCLVDEDEQQLGTVVVQRRYIDGTQ